MRAFVNDLATQHGVAYASNARSRWVQTVTRLLDDAVQPDATEQRLIALRQANVITGPETVTLLGRYQDEGNRPGMGQALNTSRNGITSTNGTSTFNFPRFDPFRDVVTHGYLRNVRQDQDPTSPIGDL